MAPLVSASMRDTALLCSYGWQQGAAHGSERSLNRWPITHKPHTLYNMGSHRPPHVQTRPCTLSAADQTAARPHAGRPAAPAALSCTLRSQAGRPARAAAQPGLQPCGVFETLPDARTCSASARPHDRHPPNVPAAQHQVSSLGAGEGERTPRRSQAAVQQVRICANAYGQRHSQRLRMQGLQGSQPATARLQRLPGLLALARGEVRIAARPLLALAVRLPALHVHLRAPHAAHGGQAPAAARHPAACTAGKRGRTDTAVSAGFSSSLTGSGARGCGRAASRCSRLGRSCSSSATGARNTRSPLAPRHSCISCSRAARGGLGLNPGHRRIAREEGHAGRTKPLALASGLPGEVSQQPPSKRARCVRVHRKAMRQKSARSVTRVPSSLSERSLLASSASGL